MVKKDYVTKEELGLHLNPIKKDINTILINHFPHLESDIKKIKEDITQIKINQARNTAKLITLMSVSLIIIEVIFRVVLS